jgi:hypothetical protein
MSTQTQPVFGFKTPDVEALPRLACVGGIEKVEGKTTAKGVYDMQVITLSPYESAPRNVTRVNFLYRPEWLDSNFDPNTLKEEFEGDKMLAVYRMHIASKTATTTLQGIAGTEEGFGQLSYALITAEDKSIEGVQAVISNYLNETQPTVGYYLQQRRRKTDEVDENGKAIYELEGGYEVGSFFLPTEDNMKRLDKQAASGRLVLTFER